MSADQTSNPDQDLADGLATLTDEERAALNETVDELKRDDRDLGEDDADEGDDTADDDATPEVAEAKPAAAPAVPQEQVADATAAEADDAEPDPDERKPRAPVFEATLPADFEERKAALQAREDEAEQKYEDGEIDRATLRATLREVAGEREALIRIQTKVELAQDIAEQEAKNELKAAVGAVMKLGTEAGIDYNNEAQWAELKAFVVAVETRHPTKSVDWIMREAHRRVLLANDITPPKAGSTPPPPPPPKTDAKADAISRRKADVSKAQPTLAGVPGSEGPGDVSGSEFSDLDALEGPAFEAALERLRKSNPAAYEKYMAET